jgi:hypothetical protein
MARFPWIRTLSLTVDLDSHIGAGDSAQHAARAFFAFLHRHGVISPGVEFGRWDNEGFFAGMDAKMTLLAEFPVNDDAGFHRCFSFLMVTKKTLGCASKRFLW